MSRPRLAVVIPAYNEAARLRPTLTRIREYLSAQSYDWIVIVASDGSKDDTNAIAADFAREDARFSLLAFGQNRGKGAVVRDGMLSADADYLLFSDADLAAPIEEIEKLWPELTPDVPIAIGSRPLKESRLDIRQPFYREWLGRLFNLAVQLLAVRGIKDTQCGFKLFEKSVSDEVFSRCKLDGFGFDFESLMIARDLGYRIAEVPIRWSHQEGSKVTLMRDGPKMIWELLKLRSTSRTRRMAVREDAPKVT